MGRDDHQKIIIGLPGLLLRVGNLGIGKHLFKTVEQVHWLCTVTVALLFIEHRPHQSIAGGFMDYAQHQDVEVGGVEGPVGAVYAQNPGLGDASNTHDHLGELLHLDFKRPEESLHPFVI